MNTDKVHRGVCCGDIHVHETERLIHLPTLHTKVHFSVGLNVLRSVAVGGRFFKICENFLDWFVKPPTIPLPPVTLGSRTLFYNQLPKDVIDTLFIRGGKYPLVFPDDLLVIITNEELVSFLFKHSRKICFFLRDRYGKECRIMVGCDVSFMTLEAFDVNPVNHRIDHHKIIPKGTLVIEPKSQ